MIGGFLSLGLHGLGDGIVSIGLGSSSDGGEPITTPSGAPFKLRAVTPARRLLRTVTAPRRKLVLVRST